jgi:heat shock protein HslJ
MRVATAVVVFLMGLTAESDGIEASRATPTPAARAAASLEGPVWRLRALGDRGKTAVAAGQGVTAEFESGRVSGVSACNRFTGSFTLKGDRLTLSPLAGTLMACDEPAMALENSFLKAFAGTVRFRIAGGRLTVTAASGTKLVFEAEAAVFIEGTQWKVTNYNNGRQAVVSLEEGTAITLAFQDGTAHGNAGCNDFRAAYALDGHRLSIKAPSSTRKACPNEAWMTQERAFLAALETAATWTVRSGVLELRTADDAMVLLASAGAPTTFRARGNEPFWALEIGPAGLTYSAPGEEPVVFPYAPARELGGKLSWKTTLGGSKPRTLDAVLEKRPCQDTMSGERFPWTAEVHLDGRLLRGCAHDGSASSEKNRP